MSNYNLNNPFRPLQIHEGAAHPGGGGESRGGFAGAVSEGSAERAKLRLKLGVGATVACALYVLMSFIELPSFDGPNGPLIADRSGGMVSDDGDYEIAKFVDEETLGRAIDPEQDETRNVAEANRRAGFFRSIFCRGLRRPSYCD